MRALIIAGLMLATPVVADSTTSVTSAYYTCALLDGTGLTSSPCDVDGWGSTVRVSIDMTASEARDLCGDVAGLLRSKGRSFDAGWTLQIRSPHSGSESIAYCDL